MEEDLVEEVEEEIFRAIREGDEGVVISLLDAEPELLEKQDGLDGYTPLIMAARHGRLDVVRLLIQRGANIEALEPFSATALHIAAGEGHEEVVNLLLSKGARANRRDMTGETALEYASSSGHLSVVKMLLRHMGVQGLQERTYQGHTALHFAAGRGKEETVKLLILAGADPTIRDNQGRTPRAVAEQEVPADIDADMSDEEEAIPDDEFRAMLARCVTVFEWWDGELERRYVLYKATCLHKAYTTQRDMPTFQVPTYLEARVAGGHAVPGVELVLPQSEEQLKQEEKAAVLEYVMQGLNEELRTELLEGFHSAPILEVDQEEDHRGDEEEV